MYYPYLRGHKSELMALCGLAQKIAGSGKIMPIIEPVNLSPETVSTLKTLKDANMPFIFIANPMTGRKAPEIPRVKNEVYKKIPGRNGCCRMGMIINNQTALSQVETFVESFANAELCLVHFENFSNPAKLAALVAKSPGIKTQVFIEGKITRKYMLEVDVRAKTVLIRDCLKRHYIYSSFPAEELFSDMHAFYAHSGFDGFGDFSVLGNVAAESNKNDPYLSVHFPYFRKKENQIWVKHFVFNVESEPFDQNNALSEILQRIVSFLEKHPSQARTEGSRELVDFYKSSSCQDLEKIKSAVLKHHLEIVISCF